MLLIAACPGGNISSYASNIAKANVSLSIVLTTISSLSCVITTPLLFTITSKLFLKVDSMNFEISFLEMMQSVSKIVLLPLIIGVYLNIKFPNSVKKVLPYVKMLSFLIFIGFIIAAVMGNLDNLYRHIHIVFLIVIAHNLLGLFGGYFFSRAFQLNETDARTIAIEVGIQNSGLALVLIFNFFDRNGGMSLIAAWWSIWHLISALGLARYWQWRDMSTRSALI
jgi:BASS family bile acid:Na+ symporter